MSTWTRVHLSLQGTRAVMGHGCVQLDMSISVCLAKAWVLYSLYKSLKEPHTPCGATVAVLKNGNPRRKSILAHRRQVLTRESHNASRSTMAVVTKYDLPIFKDRRRIICIREMASLSLRHNSVETHKLIFHF